MKNLLSSNLILPYQLWYEMLRLAQEALQTTNTVDTSNLAESLVTNFEDRASEPFDLVQKKEWDAVRFGHLEHTRLGDLSECVREDEMRWPDYERTFLSGKGYTLLYKQVDVEREAERVAEIYRRGVDEMKHNSEYEWHHRPNEIRERVRTGNFSIWGTYEDGVLIGVNSAEFIRGQRAVHWIWGAVDPSHRGKGVWENIGVYMDKMIELTNAQYGLVWMATTHLLSQRMAEKAGWKPVGVFPGGEFMAGSDGKYYRQNAVWYIKLYGDGLKHVQATKDTLLTPLATRLAKVAMEQGETLS